MLLFKKKFLPAIRAGLKTQTIRLWKYRRMREGQRSYIPGVGYIRIVSVDEVAIEDLTDADALPDGFASAAALRHEIEQLYPCQIAAGHQAYRIVFCLAPDETKHGRHRRPPATSPTTGPSLPFAEEG